MLEKIRRGGTPFFDTYYIYDPENHKYIGLLEDHCRGVKNRYFVGWYFGGTYYPESRKPGKTRVFNDEKAALNYILNGGAIDDL